MANYDGFLTPQPITHDNLWSSDLQGYSITGWTADFASDLTYAEMNGTRRKSHPVEIQGSTLNGAVMPSYFDDFYNRVHVLPESIGVGNLTAEENHSIEVWSAYMTTQQLASVSETDTDGMVLSQPSAPPTTYGILESRIHTITISLDGPATIDGSYTFNFPSDNPVLSITGARILTVPFIADWSNGIIERLLWKTSVAEAYSGKEQRRSLRNQPRREFDIDFKAISERRRSLEAVLSGWQSKRFALPIFPDTANITTAVSAGATTVDCDTSIAEFADGGLAVLFDHDGNSEVFGIYTVGSGVLNVDGNIAGDWPITTRIAPAKVAKLASSVRFSRFTHEVAEGHATFGLEEYAQVIAIDSADTYRGHPVYLTKSNWDQDPEQQFMRREDILDNMTGVRYYDDVTGRSYLAEPHDLRLTSRAEVDAFKAWLYARKGRAKLFWKPTWRDDLIVNETIAGGNDKIRVEHCRYGTLLLDRIEARDIILIKTDGTMIYRRITAATEINAGTEELTVDTVWPGSILVEEVERVMFLRPMRLDTDIIEIDWWTYDQADSTINMRTLNDDI